MTDQDLHATLTALNHRVTALERQLTAALATKKPATSLPFCRQKEAIQLLGCRATLQRCEKAGWFTAAIRRRKMVQYKRQDVLASVYRLSQGDYPEE